MQYHLSGLRTGDPDVSEPAQGCGASGPDAGVPSEVDVLIVGCGPAGLTLAAQLAAFPEIRTCIVDQKPGPLELGQADGIACRTMEMFQAFGFAERVLRESYWVNETTFWGPHKAEPNAIVRNGRIQDVEDDLSEFPHVILNQARVHDFYLDVMRNAPNRLEPHYARRLTDLTVAAGDENHPVTAMFERKNADYGNTMETIRARYVVGCDGARSAVRKSIGRELRGDSANQAWGVMDVLAVTDFPDIRLKAAIHSADEGSVLIIPREGGYLVRLYIELDKLADDERVSQRNITSDYLIAAAKRILRPYTLEVKEIAWWSVYEIGQRLCDRFDDVPKEEAGTRAPRVFIAGDACHTHSPKAGQGMNVSMQDGFNLGWKLASVLRGHASADLLHTYTAERQGVAKELIDFDRAFAKMFSARPKGADVPDEEGVDPAEFQQYFQQSGRFTAGTAIRYHPSIICGDGTYQNLATGQVIGMRFHSAPVIRVADARPLHLGHTVRADGRWRIFAFADGQEPDDPSSGIRALCSYLADDPTSPVQRYTPSGSDIDAVIDVRAVYQQDHRALELAKMPPFLLPQKGLHGLTDYEKIFCSGSEGRADIFTLRGIDRKKGCIVLVRPDQHIAQILPLDSHVKLSEFFEAYMA